MVDCQLIYTENSKINQKYMLTGENIHMFPIRGYYYLHDISFKLGELRNILSAVNQTHGHFLSRPLDPEVGLYRGRARVSFVE